MEFTKNELLNIIKENNIKNGTAEKEIKINKKDIKMDHNIFGYRENFIYNNCILITKKTSGDHHLIKFYTKEGNYFIYDFTYNKIVG